MPAIEKMAARAKWIIKFFEDLTSLRIKGKNVKNLGSTFLNGCPLRATESELRWIGE